MVQTEWREAALRSPLSGAVVGNLGVLLVFPTSRDFTPILLRPQLSCGGEGVAFCTLYFTVDLRTIHLVAE